MSLEIYVLSDQMLTSISKWQIAIDASGFPLRLSTENAFDTLRGALPVRLNDRLTAFECDHCSATDLINDYSDIDFGRSWSKALAFRWGGDIDAGVAAYAAAASYAQATGGVILDCEEGDIISPQRAGEIAAEIDASRADVAAAVRKALEQMQK